ncbi:4F2 cell-surface antigen heavy chain-like [Sitophilus oryzae]|uniref:4F2 cell-surface antigen heavy chain-like n=1 Tax=Sitophilus oryzae TaxID=7048 RepID=A0A6J2XPG4_SITOR|nr:4F2 cell-surface antigen heavy chain-like [Sitophilus oryzae]XP_030753257.1 4F2 cell-surface antigen heavy chain-like [Sitophilus oryzae]XP_030753258.1 4F2 cell-surface antigen heavy chain-like [Sitophilus oryzae]XP_030753259.1 4F2 cell-surface antigen heavy chain-like [Sitophilus oryzae]
MESFLRVNSGTNLPSSSSNSFMTDNADSTSICPLITPSPPTNALVDPLPEPTETNYTISEELAEKLQKVQDKSPDAESISSASSSADPAVCSQLLNRRNSYLHIPDDEEAAAQCETSSTAGPIQLSFQNVPQDYFFVSWNWPLIRKISLYMFLSGLAAMVALVIAMIARLPKSCNPPTEWYQGNLLYEIFPASFYSSTHGMEGDLKGIALKSDYLMNLGVRGVRLNSIFRSPHYPKDFEKASSLTEIDPILGTLEDFKSLVKHLKSRNISLILDLPVSSFIQKHVAKKAITASNEVKNATMDPESDYLKLEDFDLVEDAIQFWALHGVDGFYLKGLEHHAEDYNTARLIRRWKKLLGTDKILIISENIVDATPKENLNIILNNVDLIDVKLNIEKGVSYVTKQIDSIQNSSLFTKPGMPWVQWSLGNVNSNRLANVLNYGNATLGATLLQMMLPGTPSVFYGDEIGLHEISDPEEDRKDIKHLHQLTMMPWRNEQSKVLPWIYGGNVNALYDQVEVVSKMTDLRGRSPSIYMNSVFKQGDNKANAEVKYAEKDFLVVQRWYPRRKAYVVASNLGSNKISADLSTLLYTGQVVVGPRADSTSETISFKEVNLWPGESVVIVLD